MGAHALARIRRGGSFQQELTGTMYWKGVNQTFAFPFFFAIS